MEFLTKLWAELIDSASHPEAIRLHRLLDHELAETAYLEAVSRQRELRPDEQRKLDALYISVQTTEQLLNDTVEYDLTWDTEESLF